VREGRINGMPASQALTEVEKPAAFGKEYANANIAKMGLSGAVADYHRRSAEGAKPAEPGNLAELKARDAGATTTAQGVIGPLQQALNASKIRRDGYAADSAAAGKITAGLNSAPTPKLDTTFPVATAPTLSRPAPTAPTLSRPAPTLSNTESTLSRDIRRKAEGEESLAKRRKVISDAHKAKADKIPSPFPSLGDDSGINRIFRSIVASNTK
jgi:hypothetical protein